LVVQHIRILVLLLTGTGRQSGIGDALCLEMKKNG
jgi:hypothetical protein